MVQRKWKRLLTGIMCASLVFTEAACMDIRSYAAETGQIADSQLEGESQAGAETDTDEAKTEQPDESTEESEEAESEIAESEETESETAESEGTESETAEPEETESEISGTEAAAENGTDGEKNRNIAQDGEMTEEREEEPVNDGTDGNGGTDTVVSRISDSELLDTPTAKRLELMQSAGDIKLYGISNDIVWTLDANGQLTIVGTGEYETVPVTYSGDASHELMGAPWYDNGNKVKVQSAKVIVRDMESPAYMFAGCGELTSVDLSGLDTGSVKNMSHMFYGCSQLENLDLSGLNTENAEDMSYLFARCNELENLDLSGFDTKNVTDMKYMFYQCSGLTNLDLSHFITDNVTDMSYMFAECNGLVGLDMSRFDTANVTDMSCMFGHCTSLKSLEFSSSFQTGKVTNIGGMFTDCSSLVTLDLGSFDLANAESIDFGNEDIGFLDECSGLTAIFTPRNLKNSVIAALPADGTDWYDKDGKIYTDLPADTAESILLMKGQQANVAANSIVVQKVKTEYVCGDKIDTDDLTVIYFDENKSAVIVKDYTTNADEIDMSVLGKKTLTVTYEVNGAELKGDIELNVLKAAQVLNSSNVTVTFPDKADYDYGYDGKPKEPALTVSYKGDGGETVPLVKGTDYTVTYHNNVNAYEEPLTRSQAEPPTAVIEGIGEYSGTVSVPFNIDKAAAPAGETLEVCIEQYETEEEGRTLSLSGCFENCGEKTGYEIIEVKEDDAAAGNIFSQIPETKDIDGKGVLTYSTNAGEGNDFATIKINVSFRNYRDAELSVKIVFSGKESVRITGISMADSVYNKRAVSYGGTAKVWSEDGKELTEEVALTYRYSGTQADGTDYPASENAPVHAGDYMLTVAVAEENEDYAGSEVYPFKIQKASVVITARDVELQVGDPVPVSYLYDVSGLVNGDTLKRRPEFTFRDGNGNIVEKPDTDEAGSYAIIPDRADAGTDYTIRYREGILTINGGIDAIVRNMKPQVYTGNALKPTLQVYGDGGVTLLKEGKDYTVSYKMNKNASALDEDGKPLEGGYKITEPDGSTEAVIVEEGFDETLPHVIIKGKGAFSGTIYKNFVILRADISDQDNGLADGFSMKYTDQMVKNNKKAQAVFGSLKYKKAMKLGTEYTVSLEAGPDVQYGGNSVPDDGEIPSMWEAQTEQKGKKYIAPAIPKGYYGSFTMTVSGIGNYTGTVVKTIVVAEDAGHLMQKATVTLGASQKKVTGITRERLREGITLQPGYYDAQERKYYPIIDDEGSLGTEPEDKKNMFTVKCGSNYLIYGRDYTVAYSGNNAVGTASMTIIGKGEYVGSRKVTFLIAGEAFNAKNVGIKSYNKNGTIGNGLPATLPYTGKEVRLDNIILTNGKATKDPDYRELVYGIDYTVSYKNNKNKGTATIIFTANPESGYSGSFKKTFRIEAAELADTVRSQNEGQGVSIVRYTSFEEGKAGSIKSISLTEPVSYTKGGVRPSVAEKVSFFRSDNRDVLIEGKDYTVSYQNNTAVTTDSTKKKPVIVIKGKGNYKGTLKIDFTISKASLEDLTQEAVVTAVQYQKNRKAGYEYKPAIKIMDGKTVLKAGRDYKIEYWYNTQAELSKCFDAEEGTVSGMMKAMAIITVPENSNYQLSKANANGIAIPLGDYIYQEKLVNDKNVYVVTSPAVYTGGQVKTEVRVYYGAQEDVQKAKRMKETDHDRLTDENGYHLQCLAEDEDYTLVWGTNRTVGKNKGSVKIIGKGMKYGGSINVKFTIEKKAVYKK